MVPIFQRLGLGSVLGFLRWRLAAALSQGGELAFVIMEAGSPCVVGREVLAPGAGSRSRWARGAVPATVAR